MEDKESYLKMNEKVEKNGVENKTDNNTKMVVSSQAFT